MNKCSFVATWRLSRPRLRGRRWWALAGLLAALSAPLHADQNSLKGGWHFFTNQTGNLNIPQASAGTVLTRDYLTPQNLCGAAQCSVASFWQVQAGSSSPNTTGPTCTPTTNPGLCTQVVINGQLSAGFAWSGQPVIINQPVEFQVVSNGKPLTSQNMGLCCSEGGRNYQYWFVDASATNALPTQRNGFRVGIWNSVLVIQGTCTVPDQTITLPPVTSNQFNGVGSTTGTQPFTLFLNNCPAGWGRLGYSLIPVGAAVCPTTSIPNPCAITSTSANGVLPLSASSTASGIGIQVTDTSGSPLPFRYSITAVGITSSLKPAGSWTVPLIARYIQTGSAITPGSVSSQMQVLLDYQ
ncbi:fimbrial protein [Dyella sp. RRB7]|uniref:fimbrial protein n=1 Tax=Dyella sp. RRB7 TaxID=2919502 RepID=UPI001FAB3188|nr:fimbrial protein [Dyella sp. RRB7]